MDVDRTSKPADSQFAEEVQRSGWGVRQPLFRRRPRSVVGEIPEGSNQVETLRREALYRRLLAVADMASAAIAVIVSVRWVGHDTLQPAAILLLPLAPLLSKAIGLYDHDQHVLHKLTLDEAPTLFGIASLYTLMLWLSGSLFVIGELGRDQVAGLWILLFLSMTAGRALARLI